MEPKHKPNIITALQLIAAKKQLTELYEKIDQLTNQMVASHAPGRFDYSLNEVGPALMDFQGSAQERQEIHATVMNLALNGSFFKIEITDNLATLQATGRIFKSASFTAFSTSHRSLKKRPESLKEKDE